MRKSLASLAPAALLAAAVMLPAIGAMTVASSTAQAQNAQIQRVQLQRINPRFNPRLNRHHINPNLTSLRRCYASRRYLYVKSMRILRHSGFRNVRYVRYARGHCRQKFLFTTCKGHRRFRVVVRFAYGRYAGMTRRFAGYCRTHRRGYLQHRS